MIAPGWIYGHCANVQTVGGLIGHPGLQAGVLLVEAKHPKPPRYLCNMRRVVLGSGII